MNEDPHRFDEAPDSYECPSCGARGDSEHDAQCNEGKEKSMDEASKKAPFVYLAICGVMRAMAERGISKDRKQTQANYMFRGIDDVYAALSRVLVQEGLLMLPRVMSSERHEITTAKGALMTHLLLSVEFDLVSVIDGSKHTIRVVGEGFDSGDKASGKAMSTAYKYAAFQAFCIPVEGHSVDVEDDHEERAAIQAEANKPGLAKGPRINGDKSAALRADYVAAFDGAKSIEQVAKLAVDAGKAFRAGELSKSDLEAVVGAHDAAMKLIGNGGRA